MAALATATIVSALLITSGTALAVHDAGLFELDTSGTPLVGNANVADQAIAGDDWENVYKSETGLGTAGPASAFDTSFTTDPVGSAENSFFTGGGSKDERDVSDWLYATTNDVVPDKDDLAHAFAAAYTNPADDHTHVYFGVDRYDNNGDAETGFWFFQDDVSLGANGHFIGEHELGDVLVLADWGGSNPVGRITIYEWVGGKNPLALVADSSTADCAVAGTNDRFCAVVNRATVTQPWPFLDKAGSTTIRPLELFEAGIDLNDLFGDEVCFASFLANTRSSHSTTAQLKDFVLGDFEQCGAAITIEEDAVNEVGDEHTFTVHVTQSTGGTNTDVEGAFPEVTLTASGGAAVDLIEDTCADDGTNTGTDADGECTVTFTSDTPGLITAHAEVTVTIGDDEFFVETDGEGSNSSDAVKRFVDAYIVLSPLTDTNEINDNHDVTATVYQDDGLPSTDAAGDDADGFGPAPNGTTVQFSLLNNSASAVFEPVTGTSCATDAGACTITINTTTPGDVDIHATTTFSVGGVSLTRASDGTGSNSVDANKVYVDAYITIAPDETNPVGEPHTFTVTVFKNLGLGGGYVAAQGEHVSFTLTNGGNAVAVLDAASSTCDNAGANTNAAGQCTIVFVSATPGTVTGHASVTVTINGVALARETDDTGLNSDDAVKTYITGAIKILKDSTKGGAVAQAGAVFSVTGDLLPAGFQVTDNGTNDGDPDIGEICVGGVTPGSNYTVNEVTPPNGYGDASQSDLVAVGVSGTCSTATFGAANTVTFINPPLFDIQVNYRDGGSTETSIVSITCDGNSTLDAAPATGWDDSKTTEDIAFVDENVDPAKSEMTIQCTLVVDP